MWATIWGYIKKFWWILALAGTAVFFWLRGKLREAERAAVIQKQLDIETKLRTQLDTTDFVSRDERRKFEQEVEAGRAEVEQKKSKLESEISADANSLAAAWDRAFGPRRPTPPVTPH